MHFAHFWRENSNFLSKITVFSNQSKSLIYIITIIHLQREIYFRIFQSEFCHFWRKNSNCLSTITTFSNQSKSLIYIIAIIHLQREIYFRSFQSAFCPFLAQKFKLFKQYHSVFKSVKMSYLQYCNNSS